MSSQSLAAEAGALATELVMPGIFNQPQDKLKDRYIAPYITFAHPKRANEWAKITAKFPGVQEGDMFLVEQDGITKLDVVKLGILKAAQYWAEAKADGTVISTSFVERPKPFKEHIEAVVLVYMEDRLLPANVSPRSTKCPAFKLLSDSLIKAATPEWGDEGASYKETLALPQPFMRFYGEVKLGDKQIGKQTGLPYKPTVCTIHPAGIPEIRLLKDFVTSDTAQKVLNDAAERFAFRMAEVKQMSTKNS